MESILAPDSPRAHLSRRRRPARALAALVAVVAASLALAGCGLRLETDPPAPLVPDATEIARSGSADAEAKVRDIAGELATRKDVPSSVDAAAWQATMTQAHDFAIQHLTALGDPDPTGTATPSAASTASPSPSPTASASAPAADLTTIATPTLVTQLGQALTDAYDAARTSIPTVSGEFSRLLASISTADLVLAHNLSGQLATAVPNIPAPAVPTSPTPATATVASTPQGTSTSAPTSSGEPTSDAGAKDGAGTDATASASADPTSPDSTGLDLNAWLPIVAAEDQAGFAFETYAAQMADAPRKQAVASAASHRALGQTWSDSLGLADTTKDPRLPLYAVPQVAGADAAFAACAPLETALATVYADLVFAVPADQRLAAANGLAASTMASLTWGATPMAFPGLS